MNDGLRTRIKKRLIMQWTRAIANTRRTRADFAATNVVCVEAHWVFAGQDTRHAHIRR